MALVPRLDLGQPSTLVRQTLTKEQGLERLRILEDQQDREPLTPRSTLELQTLFEAITRDQTAIVFREQITRQAPSRVYWIQFNQDPTDLAIKSFKDASTKVTALNTHIAAGAELEILKVLVNTPTDMGWYQEATSRQMAAILRTDFLDALKHSYVANLSLLKAATYLYKETSVYSELLKLHTKSTELHQDQIDFNRSCEITILDNARRTQRSLLDLHNLILGCGPRLDTISDETLSNCNALVVIEEERLIDLHESISKASGQFIKRLEGLRSGIDSCFNKIVKAQQEVNDLMIAFDGVLKEKEALAKRKAEVQSAFEEYQNTKIKEYGSRKAEEKLGGFWIIEWKSTEYVQGDFGSADQHQKYLKVKEDSDWIEKEIAKLGADLKGKLEKHAVAYQEAELKQAVAYLAAALSAVKQLENAVRIRKSQAETQAQLIRSRLGTAVGPREIRSTLHAVGYLTILCENILSSHAMFVQSHKQVKTIQLVRDEETALLGKVQKSLQQGTTEGHDALEAALKPFIADYSQNPMNDRMPSTEIVLKDIDKPNT